MNSKVKKILSLLLIIVFTISSFNISFAQVSPFMPAPGTMVKLSPAFTPALLKGIKVNPNEPLKFEFILDKGNGDVRRDRSPDLSVPQEALKTESTRLIKYFLTSLTVPEKELWVNLSPYEKDRIIPEAFGKTEMGLDLLAQDYLLKQITSSLMYPESEIGQKFWDKIYAEAYQKFGVTNIPVDTFNKVWIVPAKAVVFENMGGSTPTAYVVESKLKVMLEKDYLSEVKGERLKDKGKQNIDNSLSNLRGEGKGEGVAEQVIREIILPAIEKEVNEGKNFAQLRQVYNSLILAAWYKKKIKESLLSKVYVNKNKVLGVNIDDPKAAEKIWSQYVESFKKGVYDYVKEEYDPNTQQIIPKKYFSGGFDSAQLFSLNPDSALQVVHSFPSSVESDNAMEVKVNVQEINASRSVAPGSMDTATPQWDKQKQKQLDQILSQIKVTSENDKLKYDDKDLLSSVLDLIGNNQQLLDYVVYNLPSFGVYLLLVEMLERGKYSEWLQNIQKEFDTEVYEPIRVAEESIKNGNLDMSPEQIRIVDHEIYKLKRILFSQDRLIILREGASIYEKAEYYKNIIRIRHTAKYVKDAVSILMGQRNVVYHVSGIDISKIQMNGQQIIYPGTNNAFGEGVYASQIPLLFYSGGEGLKIPYQSVVIFKFPTDSKFARKLSENPDLIYANVHSNGRAIGFRVANIRKLSTDDLVKMGALTGVGQDSDSIEAVYGDKEVFLVETEDVQEIENYRESSDYRFFMDENNLIQEFNSLIQQPKNYLLRKNDLSLKDLDKLPRLKAALEGLDFKIAMAQLGNGNTGIEIISLIVRVLLSNDIEHETSILAAINARPVEEREKIDSLLREMVTKMGETANKTTVSLFIKRLARDQAMMADEAVSSSIDKVKLHTYAQRIVEQGKDFVQVRAAFSIINGRYIGKRVTENELGRFKNALNLFMNDPEKLFLTGIEVPQSTWDVIGDLLKYVKPLLRFLAARDILWSSAEEKTEAVGRYLKQFSEEYDNLQIRLHAKAVLEHLWAMFGKKYENWEVEQFLDYIVFVKSLKDAPNRNIPKSERIWDVDEFGNVSQRENVEKSDISLDLKYAQAIEEQARRSIKDFDAVLLKAKEVVDEYLTTPAGGEVFLTQSTNVVLVNSTKIDNVLTAELAHLTHLYFIGKYDAALDPVVCEVFDTLARRVRQGKDGFSINNFRVGQSIYYWAKSMSKNKLKERLKKRGYTAIDLYKLNFSELAELDLDAVYTRAYAVLVDHDHAKDIQSDPSWFAHQVSEYLVERMVRVGGSAERAAMILGLMFENNLELWNGDYRYFIKEFERVAKTRVDEKSRSMGQQYALVKTGDRAMIGANPIKLLDKYDGELKNFIVDNLTARYTSWGLAPELASKIIDALIRHSSDLKAARDAVYEIIKFNDDPKWKAAYEDYKEATKYESTYNLLLPQINSLPAGSVIVDWGAGNNALGKTIATHFPNIKVIGIDPYVYNEESNLPNLNFYTQPDQAKAPTEIPAHSVDLVTLNAVLHHVDDGLIDEVLKEIKRILKPSGKIVIIEDTWSLTLPVSTNADEITTKRFLELSSSEKYGEQFAKDYMTFNDWYANIVVHSWDGMALPYKFRSIEEWQDLFYKDGFKSGEVENLGFPKKTFHKPSLGVLVFSPNLDDKKDIDMNAPMLVRLNDEAIKYIEEMEAKQDNHEVMFRVYQSIDDRLNNVNFETVSSDMLKHAIRADKVSAISIGDKIIFISRSKDLNEQSSLADFLLSDENISKLGATPEPIVTEAYSDRTEPLNGNGQNVEKRRTKIKELIFERNGTSGLTTQITDSEIYSQLVDMVGWAVEYVLTDNAKEHKQIMAEVNTLSERINGNGYHIFKTFKASELFGNENSRELSKEIRDYFSPQISPENFKFYIDGDLMRDVIRNLGGKQSTREGLSIIELVKQYLKFVYEFETAPNSELLDVALKKLLRVHESYKFAKAVELGGVKIYDKDGIEVRDEYTPLSRLSPDTYKFEFYSGSVDINKFIEYAKELEVNKTGEGKFILFNKIFQNGNRKYLFAIRDGRLEEYYTSETYSNVAGQMQWMRQEAVRGELSTEGILMTDWYAKPEVETLHDVSDASSSKINELIATMTIEKVSRTFLEMVALKLGLIFDKKTGELMSHDKNGKVFLGNALGLTVDLARYFPKQMRDKMNYQRPKNANGEIKVLTQAEKFKALEKDAAMKVKKLAEVDSVWEDSMTDINKHKPGEYQYIVHGLYSDDDPMVRDAIEGEGVNNIKELPNYVNLWEEPQRISERKLFSASLINQIKRTVYNDVGFILQVPKDNILQASPDDLGTYTITSTDADVARLYENRNLPSPKDLLDLEKSPWFTPNEVVITGIGKDGARVKVVGVFTVVDSKTRRPVNREYDSKIRILAKKHGLPVIEIDQTDMAMSYKSGQEKKNTGGIDLNPIDKTLETQSNGGGIKFNVDQAMLERMQNAQGFEPVVTDIIPLKDLRAFLGI
ncbi:MAG: class I SAM-dependent methyltransferase [Candidatus Omnitrophica bacterium]|nr:class I SAM-dependent methyltransferase [Candidatus Omnitrophota bacterium]